MHQALGGTQGQVTDMEIAVREAKRLNTIVREVLRDGSGQPMDKIEKDTDRDFYLSASEAVEYGLIDEVLSPTKAAEAAAAN
jgi:ATP-dependent Clp protease protease subunit